MDDPAHAAAINKSGSRLLPTFSNVKLSKQLAIIACIFAIGFVVGVFAEKERWFGYKSYNDCVLQEVKDAGNNARYVGQIIVNTCTELG